jgi:hypothetical protein
MLRLAARFAPFLLCCTIFADGATSYRHWIGGREAGGLEVAISGGRVTTQNRLRIERRGTPVEQSLVQDIVRGKNGEITVNWTLGADSRPQRGRASWSPKKARELRVSSHGQDSGKADTLIPVEPNGLLWPADIDAKMRLAAKGMAPLRIAAFSFALSVASLLDLKPELKDPLGAFGDSVRYRGTLTEGTSVSQITSWISPSAGQVKQISAGSGLIVVTQRTELRPPESFGPALFEWTLRRLPQTPFLAWRDEFRVSGLPSLMETPQQKRIGRGEYLLSRAAPPSVEESRQPPYSGMGAVGAEDARFLAV